MKDIPILIYIITNTTHIPWLRVQRMSEIPKNMSQFERNRKEVYIFSKFDFNPNQQCITLFSHFSTHKFV